MLNECLLYTRTVSRHEIGSLALIVCSFNHNNRNCKNFAKDRCELYWWAGGGLRPGWQWKCCNGIFDIFPAAKAGKRCGRVDQAASRPRDQMYAPGVECGGDMGTAAGDSHMS